MKKLAKLVTSLLLCFGLTLTAVLTVGCGNKTISFEICDDTSNAIRAFQLLEAKGVISKESEGENYPVNADASELTFDSEKWTSKDGKVSVTLVAENLLVASMGDYDYACLPCNTAYTGKVDSSKRAKVEDDQAQVAGKANIIAARNDDYANNSSYKEKIDALTNAMLSQTTSQYFNSKYLGAMTCDVSTQIDLRESKDTTVAKSTANPVKIAVCASDIPHAEVLNGTVKQQLASQGYNLVVTVIDWTLQNDAVANNEYDANYFQHVPYLETYTGTVQLFASCKVHYEPLGIYYGKAKSWKF